MSKILFVDDDRYFAGHFLGSLKSFHEVSVCYEAEAAVEALKNDVDLEGAVIDVMMPPPEGKEHETHDGNTTGIWVLEQALEELKDRNIAILLYTNRAEDFVKEEIQYLELNPELAEVHYKGGIRKEDLPHAIAKLIARRP